MVMAVFSVLEVMTILVVPLKRWIDCDAGAVETGQDRVRSDDHSPNGHECTVVTILCVQFHLIQFNICVIKTCQDARYIIKMHFK